MNKLLLLISLTLLLTVLAIAIGGCDIEETEPPQAGSVAVNLTEPGTHPDSSLAITGARIFIDGVETPRVTPATLSGISAGPHRIGVFKPGYVDTAMVVDVVAHQVTPAWLQTVTILESGIIRLLRVPAETELVVNGIHVSNGLYNPADTSLEFTSVGVGTFNVTAFRPGYATALPARWTVDLTPGTVASLAPVFIRADSGIAPGNLAPDFTLPSDWDSTLYSLHDFRGRVVLVSFFFYNCTACVEEMPYISAVYNDPRYAGRVQFIGIDFSDTYDVFASFREDHPSLDVRFPLVHDRYRGAKDAYNVFTMPANYIVDPSGRISSVQGALSETGLRQVVDQLLENQDRPTLRFAMRDTLVTYTNPLHDAEFYGTIENLTAFDRPVHLTVTPVVFADTARQTGACVASDCFAPCSGPIDWPLVARANRADSVRITIYSRISDWSLGFPMPQDSALIGDYTLDVSVVPDDNAAERATYRLHLTRGGSGFAFQLP